MTVLRRMDFKASLLLAPLAYAIHHAEEHLILDFRAWRTLYFADNNPLSTEAVFVILTSVTLIYILLHWLIESRATTVSILLFLMASQVVNVVFHVGASLWFGDFSPGTITGVLVYLPVNALISYLAVTEGLITPRRLAAVLAAGTVLFAAFEALGPFPLVLVIIGTYVWIGVTIPRDSRPGDASGAAPAERRRTRRISKS